MASNPIVAQIGVFALLGLNVGAYYVFWPHKESDNKSEAKAPTQEKGVTQLLPAKKEIPAPKESPKPAPLLIPNPPATEPEKKEDDTLAKLLRHIQNEAGQQNKQPKANDVDALQPRVPPVDRKPIATPADADIVPAGALTPKAGPSPWVLQMDVADKQTRLTAKLQRTVSDQVPIQFRIQCDRTETTASGAVVALGKVHFTGAGLTATCQRLTLPLGEPRVILETDVHIIHDYSSATNLRGDRIVWDINEKSSPLPPAVAPAEFRPNDSVAPIYGTIK